MKTLTKQRKKSIGLTIAIALLIGLLVTLSLIKTNVAIAEWWSVNISRRWVMMVGHVSDLVPFAVFEIMIIILVLLIIPLTVVGVYLLVKHKFNTVLNGLLSIVIGALSIAIIYTGTAGFIYYRADIPLPYSESEITLEDTAFMYEYYIQDFNHLSERFKRDENGDVISPYDKTELYDVMKAEFALLADPYFFKYTPTPKPILNSRVMDYSFITGITFIPTGEANYNDNMPVSDKPFTIMHELAHAKGVMREGEANMVASYVLLNAGDDYLRYCGYLTIYFDIKNIVNRMANHDKKVLDELNLTPLSPLAAREIDNSNEYWSNIQNPFAKISNFFNNIYLKLNGATNGTGSYDDDGKFEDSGLKDEDNNPIIIYELSRTERMYYRLYEITKK